MSRGLRVALAAGLLLVASLLMLAIPSPFAASSASPDPSPSTTDSDDRSQAYRAVPLDLADDEILVGGYVQNIPSIEPASNSFLADVYVWYRWKNPDFTPNKSVEIMNLYQAWQLVELGRQKKPRKQSDGNYYFSQRYSAAFNAPLSLVQFPFGTQYLPVILEDFEVERGAMRFVADQYSTARNPTITLPGFDIGDPTMTVEDFSYNSDFGDLDGAVNEVYSRATLTLPVSTPGLSNVIKYLLPLVLIVGAASLVFYLPPREIEGRIALGITALLTLVAMEWNATESLPTVSYLTMLDVLYLVATFFILASLVLGLRTYWVARSQDEATAITTDERTHVIFLGVYACAFATVLIGYLVL